MEYLIVDGYNIINAWDDIFDINGGEPLEDCRDKLANMLSNYQGVRKYNIILVFDAHLKKGGREKEYFFDNIKIVYTKEGETADNYIERFVHQLGNLHTVRVATSDYLEQTMILSNGGIRMSPRELREELEMVNKDIKTVLFPNRVKTNAIGTNIDPALLEKLEGMRRGER
ncbi:MAG: NYN domain-containing protein [Bacillota bacterium]